MLAQSRTTSVAKRDIDDCMAMMDVNVNEEATSSRRRTLGKSEGIIIGTGPLFSPTVNVDLSNGTVQADWVSGTRKMITKPDRTLDQTKPRMIFEGSSASF